MSSKVNLWVPLLCRTISTRSSPSMSVVTRLERSSSSRMSAVEFEHRPGAVVGDLQRVAAGAVLEGVAVVVEEHHPVALEEVDVPGDGLAAVAVEAKGVRLAVAENVLGGRSAAAAARSSRCP